MNNSRKAFDAGVAERVTQHGLTMDKFAEMEKKVQAVQPEGLTREQIIAQLQQYGAPNIGVSGGAAMVLRGLRSSTADIDAETDTETFERLHAEHGNPELSSYGTTRLFQIPGSDIDLHDAWGEEYETVDDVNAQVQTVRALLSFYQRLNREKDQEWIRRLEALN
jgi:hypothetical protein